MAGTAIAASRIVVVRRPNFASPRPAAETLVPSSPLRSMLALSAATRAVAAESQLRPAAAMLQREACLLTGASSATMIAIDRARGTLWTGDDSTVSDEIRRVMVHVADTGQRAMLGQVVLEPIGAPPASAVLALRRGVGERFEVDDLALVAALVGGVAATLHRLIDRAFARPARGAVRGSSRPPR